MSIKLQHKMQKNDDEFEHAMKEVLQEAPSECIQNMREHLHFIKTRCPHMHKSVENCLRGLEGTPNMLKVLVAAYVLNGGIPLKYSNSKDSVVSKVEDNVDMESLLREMDEIVTTDKIF